MSSTLVVRGTEAATVFSLLGTDENSATYALGWTLSRSEVLLDEFLLGLGLDRPSEMVRIELQRHAEDAGFTDIELITSGELHVIVEAKVGGAVPSSEQLQRYRPRFGHDHPGQALVSISAAPTYAASRMLAGSVDGVPLIHLSWGDVRRMVRTAIGKAAGSNERRWLRDLDTHLEGYVLMQMTSSNMVYVVALSDQEIVPGYTWIDVVESDNAYFHPIGRGGWPASPPNYLGFRYNGQLQSVRHVESAEFVANLGDRDARWAEWTDHMLYRLGPAMRPSKALRSGIAYANRVYCAIDLLLSGACETIKQAQEATVRRQKGL